MTAIRTFDDLSRLEKLDDVPGVPEFVARAVECHAAKEAAVRAWELARSGPWPDAIARRMSQRTTAQARLVADEVELRSRKAKEELDAARRGAFEAVAPVLAREYDRRLDGAEAAVRALASAVSELAEVEDAADRLTLMTSDLRAGQRGLPFDSLVAQVRPKVQQWLDVHIPNRRTFRA